MVRTEIGGKRFLLYNYIGRSGNMKNGVIEHREAGLGGMQDCLVKMAISLERWQDDAHGLVMDKLGFSRPEVN